jgi:cobalt transporter subunit CbtB
MEQELPVPQQAGAQQAEAQQRPDIAGARSTIVLAAAVSLTLGVFVLFGVGFAQPQLLHNAAHDARHAFTFPCH